MQPYLNTVESALALIQGLPADTQEATVYVAHGATLKGQRTNVDVVESLLLSAMVAGPFLLPTGTETNEQGRVYRYAKKRPKKPDAAQPCDA
jgi:hypothetical protein